MLNRRSLLGVTGAAVSLAGFGAFIPRVASAAGTRDPRFVVIVLRGALDGLAAVPPVGDPDFSDLGREDLAARAMPLDGMFALHPSLVQFHRLFKAGQAGIIHATATAYRDRSHFDGQDVLESGFPAPGHTESGWLNRLIGRLPREQRATATGLSVGSTTPLTLRGPAEVMGWAPQALAVRDDNLPLRVMAMYQDNDPALAHAFETSLATAKLADGATGFTSDTKAPQNMPMTAMAQGAARLMAGDGGPRIAALAFTGWDTHAGEANRLNGLLSDLDGAVAAFESGLGERWRDTTILVVTEFGRTASLNGTRGSDHGTATTAFLAGGAVKAGRVIADWPGLKPAQLYQNRDLNPTTDLRAVIKGLLTGMFDVSPAVLAEVFPGSDTALPMKGLIA